MPTRKRPQPEFPPYGFLGELPNVGGSSSTEWSTTIPHPTEFGRWTNVPMLTPNQLAPAMLPGDVVLPEQNRRAADFARYLATAGGYQLPAFKTVDEAVAQAGHRHKAVAGQPSQLQGAPITPEEYQRLRPQQSQGDANQGLVALLRRAFGF